MWSLTIRGFEERMSYNSTWPEAVPTPKFKPSLNFKDVTDGKWLSGLKFKAKFTNTVNGNFKQYILDVFGAVHGTIEFADTFFAPRVPSFNPTFFGAEHEQVMHGIYSPAVHFSRLGDKRSAELASFQVQSIYFRPDDLTLDRFF
jgi:hypothetical protein